MSSICSRAAPPTAVCRCCASVRKPSADGCAPLCVRHHRPDRRTPSRHLVQNALPTTAWITGCATRGFAYAVLDAHGLLPWPAETAHGGVRTDLRPQRRRVLRTRRRRRLCRSGPPRMAIPGDPHDLGIPSRSGPGSAPRETGARWDSPSTRPLSLKLHRVTGHSAPLEAKQPYQPDIAAGRVRDPTRVLPAGSSPPAAAAQGDRWRRPRFWSPPSTPKLCGPLVVRGTGLSAGTVPAGSRPGGGLHTRGLRDVLTGAGRLRLCDPRSLQLRTGRATTTTG